MDPIDVVNTRWKLVIENVDNEIAVQNEILGNKARTEKIEYKFKMMGNSELRYLIESQIQDYEKLWRAYLNKIKAQQNWVQELQDTFEKIMAEEYEEDIARREAKIKKIVRQTKPVRVSEREPEPEPPEMPLEEEIESEPSPIPEQEEKPPKSKLGTLVTPSLSSKYEELTKAERLEVIKSVYLDLPADKRTITVIVAKTGFPKSSVHRYITEDLQLQLEGKYKGTKKASPINVPPKKMSQQ
jgi:hypothetical protein